MSFSIGDGVNVNTTNFDWLNEKEINMIAAQAARTLEQFLDYCIFGHTTTWASSSKSFILFITYFNGATCSSVVLCFARWTRWNNVPWLKKIIWVIGVLRRTVVCDWVSTICAEAIFRVKWYSLGQLKIGITVKYSHFRQSADVYFEVTFSSASP